MDYKPYKAIFGIRTENAFFKTTKETIFKKDILSFWVIQTEEVKKVSEIVAQAMVANTFFIELEYSKGSISKKEYIATVNKISKQKKILQRWFSAYTIMYNRTLKYIKDKYKKTGENYV